MGYRDTADQGMVFPPSLGRSIFGNGVQRAFVTSQLVPIGKSSDAFTPAKGRAFAVPYWVTVQTQIDDIGLNIKTAGSGDSRVDLGVYRSLPDYFAPGDLIESTGPILHGNVTGISLRSAIGPMDIDSPTVIWLACLITPASTVAPEVAALGEVQRTPSLGMDILGNKTGGDVAQGYTAMINTDNLNALPDPFWPNIANAGTSEHAPLVFIGVV